MSFPVGWSETDQPLVGDLSSRLAMPAVAICPVHGACPHRELQASPSRFYSPVACLQEAAGFSRPLLRHAVQARKLKRDAEGDESAVTASSRVSRFAVGL